MEPSHGRLGQWQRKSVLDSVYFDRLYQRIDNRLILRTDRFVYVNVCKDVLTH